MTSRKRKGISPIIATVLLIAITIAAGLAIYGWVSGLIGAGTSSRLTGTTPLSLTVVSAGTTSSSGDIAVNISISNQGSHDVMLNITNIQIVSSAGYVEPATDITGIGSPSNPAPSSITPFRIPAGEVTTVEITTTLPAGTYTLSIVGATDTAGNTVIANSVSFTVQ